MGVDSDYESVSESESRAQPNFVGSSTSIIQTSTANSSKGKGKATANKPKRAKKSDDAEVKRRSTKACDNCRKQKSKCARIFDPATQEPVGGCQNCLTAGVECTFNGATRKRGPPKGYIEAIESRLHRMEALLGGILQNDDPRAQALLGELIGDEESRDMLARDLKAATSSSSKPEKSWKREFALQQEAQALQEKKKREDSVQQTDSFMLPAAPNTGDQSFSSGFPESINTGQNGVDVSGWFTEEDLGFGGTGLPFGQQTSGGSAAGASGTSDSPAFLSSNYPANPIEFSNLPPAHPSFPQSNTNVSPIPIPQSQPQSSSSLLSTSQISGSNSFPSNIEQSSSPRQRRRLDLENSSQSGQTPGSTSSSSTFNNKERKQMAYSFNLPTAAANSSNSPINSSSGGLSTTFRNVGPVLPKGAIAHTGQSVYTLASSNSGLSPRSRTGTSNSTSVTGGGGTGEDGNNARLDETASPGTSGNGTAVRSRNDAGNEEGPDSELADVIGQLSLNENEEVRYHGRSSGLYLISKSQRFRDFFWQFPSAGVWPKSDGRVAKTEREILGLAEGEDPLPDLEQQHHLLTAYWTHVHPHFPILYKVSFMRQYRHSLAHSNPSNAPSPSNSFGHGPFPIVLLLSMFALSARYCDLYPASGSDGKFWDAGQEFIDKARKILNHEYGSSKLVMVQTLLLIAYREIGVGAMSSSWMAGGMAIRMAQDLGLFRDVEKWFLPVQRFTHEEKQTRKRVWWGCIIIDRYTSSYIGRPGAIHERDYDTGFCSEDEPDEHEQWRPIRLDGTDFHSPPKNLDSQFPEEISRGLKNYPTTRAHTLSCFNAHAALAVIINRIISNIYAIRIRVLGQSSETLLSLLDQSLASWFLALPPHLAYNPASSKIPAPHILALHLQFYSSLILLHRPFIPGQNSLQPLGSFPSHSICTTSANAIANIVTIWRKTFTLRQCPPFVTYPLFSAAIICVYNASFDEALARPAKLHLRQCMDALKEMELQWGSAIRAYELLHGLVDLRDSELNAELAGLDADAEGRGTKRATMEVDPPANEVFAGVRPTNFHNNPARPVVGRSTSASRGRRQSSSSLRTTKKPSPSLPQPPVFGAPAPATVPTWPISLPEQPLLSHPPIPQPQSQNSSMFSHQPPDLAIPTPPQGATPSAQTFDILNPALDLSQFRSPPGTSGGGTTNFSDLLNSFMSPTEAAASLPGQFAMPPVAPSATTTGFDPNAAFFGMPLGAVDEWYQYSFNAFAAEGHGSTPGSVPTVAGSASPEATARGPLHHRQH
ncbi:uncharacterized protein JCM6883_005446 [Sporobolomyces salmoneus]|uniref:uncharacterized protein n=1 Tax=Sporobolomyces salmoneus TaxID=183962 RepID=UPI00316BB149